METAPITPPIDPLKTKRKAKKEIQYFSEQEIELFFRVIRDVRDRALFRLIYHRGLRASEPGRLRLEDYRPGPGRPRLLVKRCKGSITAEHVLIDVEAAAMKAWLRVRGNSPGALFRTRQGTPLGSQRVWTLMRHYCALAGIPREKAHPHALKHSCGTHLVRLLGGNVVEIQDHMGHADIRNTMRYLRSTDRETRGDRLAGWGKR